MFSSVFTPIFLDDYSIPDESVFVWAYHIKISNAFDSNLIIKKRVFNIIDSQGQVNIVESEGMFGEVVTLKPKKDLNLVSGLILSQPSGIFLGTIFYEFQKKDFAFEIPPFSLDSPYDSGFKN
jgi:ApaG protein